MVHGRIEDHLLTNREGGTEGSSKPSMKWILSIVTDRPSRDQLEALTRRWRYSHRRAVEHPGNRDPATERQVKYIKVLRPKAEEAMPGVFDELWSLAEAHSPVIMKGQASWLIQRLQDVIEDRWRRALHV